MSTISRYANVSKVSGAYYATADFPDASQLASIPTISVRTTSMDRLDTLAYKHLGHEEYWWMIAVLNNIEWAFDFAPGDILKIPVNVNDMLQYF